VRVNKAIDDRPAHTAEGHLLSVVQAATLASLYSYYTQWADGGRPKRKLLDVSDTNGVTRACAKEREKRRVRLTGCGHRGQCSQQATTSWLAEVKTRESRQRSAKTIIWQWAMAVPVQQGMVTHRPIVWLAVFGHSKSMLCFKVDTMITEFPLKMSIHVRHLY